MQPNINDIITGSKRKRNDDNDTHDTDDRDDNHVDKKARTKEHEYIKHISIPKLDLRLFAHIFNDPDLSGSYLEGSNLNITITYVYHFLHRFLNDEIQLKGITKKEAHGLVDFFEPIIELFSHSVELEKAEDKQELETSLTYFTNTLFTHFNKYKSICVAGGWSGTPGHAMLYEFCKEPNDEIVMLVWNTGAGLQNHLWEETMNGKIYSPVKAFRIPPLNERTTEYFKQYLTSLIEPRYLPKIDRTKYYDETIIYNQIIPQICFCDGKEIDPSPYVKRKIPGQFSGTCAWQVVNELLINREFTNINIDQFNYELMKDALSQFCKELTKKDWQDEKINNQLAFGIKNYASVLKRLENDNALPYVSLKEGFQLLSEIKEKAKQENVLEKEPSSLKSTLSQLYRWTCSKLPAIFNPTPIQIPNCPIVNTLDHICNVEDADFLQYRNAVDLSLHNFDDISLTIKAEVNKENTTVSQINDIAFIEHLLITLPLSKTFYQEQTHESLFSFLASLENLTHKYAHLCKQLDGYAYGERIVAVDSAFSASLVILQSIFKDKEEIFYQIWFGNCYLTKRYKHNGYQTLVNAKIARRAREILTINKLIRENYKTPNENLDPILLIANHNPHLVSRAASEGIHNSEYPVSERERAGIYYYKHANDDFDRLKEFSDVEKEIQAYFNLIKLDKIRQMLYTDNLFMLKDWGIKPNEKNWTDIDLLYLKTHSKYVLKYTPSIKQQEIDEGNKKRKCNTYIFQEPCFHKDFDSIKYLKGNYSLENKAQIKFGIDSPSWQLDLRKNLTQAVTYEKTQTTSLIEIFKSNTYQIHHHDLQQAIFASLFNGHWLSECVLTNPRAIDGLLVHIKEIHGIYLKRESGMSVQIFLLKMAVFLHQVLVSSMVDANDADQIAMQIKSCENIIDSLFDRINSTDITHFRIIYSCNLHRFRKILSPTEWAELYKANYLFNLSEHIGVDPFVIKEAKMSMDYLKCNTASTNMDEMVLQAALLTVLQSKINLRGHFPLYQQGDTTIDFLNGEVKIQNKSLQRLPAEITQDRTFQLLFSSKLIKATKIGPNHYEFIHNDEKYMVTKEDQGETKTNNNIEFYRKIGINGKNAWFKFHKPSIGDTSLVLLYCTLPHTLFDSTHQIWNHESSFCIVDFASRKIKYQYDGKFIHKLDPSGKQRWMLIELPAKLQHVLHFEGKQFIESWLDTRDNTMVVELPRYGIKLLSSNDGKWLFKQNGKQYDLILNKCYLFKNFNNFLTLSPIGNHNPENYVYAIPNQTLQPTKDFEADFYRSSIDINNHEKTAAHLRFSHQTSGFDERLITLLYNPQFHVLKKQETIMIVRKVSSGELVVDSHIDRLKLAYLCFGKRDPAKAFALLKGCHIISGSLEELSPIINIINNTPSCTVNPLQQKEMVNSGPEYTSVRALACYLLTKYLNTGKYEGIIGRKNGVEGKINGDANEFEAEAIKKFLACGITDWIKEILTRYFNIKDHIPKDLRLKSNQIDTLCNKMHEKSFFAKHYQKQKRKNSGLIHTDKGLIPNAAQLKQKKISLKLEKTSGVNDYIQLKKPVPASFIRINQLTLRTDIDILDFNLCNLHCEANRDPKSKEFLRELLLKKLEASASNWQQILEKDPRKICIPLVLFLMLEKDNYISYRESKALLSSWGSSLQFNVMITKAYPQPEKLTELKNKQKNHMSPIREICANNISSCRSLENILQSMELVELYQPENSIIVQDDAPLSDLLLEAKQDYVAGKMFNATIQAKKEYYTRLLDNNKIQALLLTKINQALNEYVPISEKLSAKIVTLINQGPKKIVSQMEWQVSLQNNVTRKLNLHETLQLFSNKSVRMISHSRHLSVKQIKAIYYKVLTYLQSETNRQHLLRAKEKIAALDGSAGKYYELGKILTQKRCYDVSENYDVLLFEFTENKLIYSNQYQIIQSFLEKDKNKNNQYASKTIQQIPGSGKSKIILPLLAQLRADGEHLIIIEVPPSLFETNANDLEAISLKSFGKRPMSLLFSRNMKCDAKYFKQLFHDLHDIKVNKQYLITTKNSTDSLALKYIDLLNQPQSNLNEWKQQIFYLDKVINLLRTCGNVISDEIDTNLNTKDNLIYTIDPGKPINSQVLQALIGLHGFLKQNHSELYLALTKEAPIPSLAQQASLFERVAFDLIDAPSSPLFEMLLRLNLSPNEKECVKGYLLNQKVLLPVSFTEIDKEIIAVYREELNHLLKVMFNKERDVHYGLSKDKAKDEIEQMTAIPYLSNNVPNENSKFQNCLLTNNYTIMIHLKDKLHHFSLKKFVSHFKQLHEKNMEQEVYSAKLTHNYSHEFKDLTGYPTSLDAIDLDNASHMDELYECIKDNIEVKKYCLREFILPSILTNAETLSSNVQNHVQLFPSYSGFTGTDYNWRTFHDSIQRDTAQTKGTDGRTIDLLLQKEGTTHVLNTKSSDLFFKIIDSHPESEKIHAIIDTGSLFSGIDNIEVAHEWANHISHKTNASIRFVLFFNEKGQLCALTVSKDLSKRRIINLTSSENIATNLKCRIDEYVTYYDQSHSTGIDIKNTADAIGLTTHDLSYNILRDDIQGVNRLRELAENQRVEFVLLNAPDMAAHQGWNVQNILNHALTAQNQFLMKEHLNSGCQKIANHFRGNLFTKICKEKSLTNKLKLANAFKPVFYYKDETTFFEKYGQFEDMVLTKIYLNNFANVHKRKWNECLLASKIAISSSEEFEIDFSVNSTIEKTVSICDALQKSRINDEGDNQAIAFRTAEVEQEQEQEKELQIEKPPKVVAENYKAWHYFQSSRLDQCRSLNQVLKSEGILAPFFSDQILVSSNYITTCKNAGIEIFNSFKKPCFYILNRLSDKKVIQVMITQQEAAELHDIWDKKSPQSGQENFWIETPSKLLYCGCRPSDIEKNLSYQQLNEQVCFFNGDIAYLTTNAYQDRLTWLNDDTIEKIAFLEKYVVPYSLSKVGLLKALKNKLDLEQPSLQMFPKTKCTQSSQDQEEIFENFNQIHLELSDTEEDFSEAEHVHELENMDFSHTAQVMTPALGATRRKLKLDEINNIHKPRSCSPW